MKLTETHVIRRDGEISDYVFIDPTERTHYPVPDRIGFTTAVSFSVSSRLSMNYPVVFDDHTTSSGERLEPIAFEEVPPAIKRKLTAWLRLQPEARLGMASGPAGTPVRHIHAAAHSGGAGGSDRVKEELVRLHPGTRHAEWKRRSRSKSEDGVIRRFEHVDGRSVETIERPDGGIFVREGGDALGDASAGAAP